MRDDLEWTRAIIADEIMYKNHERKMYNVNTYLPKLMLLQTR